MFGGTKLKSCARDSLGGWPPAGAGAGWDRACLQHQQQEKLPAVSQEHTTGHRLLQVMWLCKDKAQIRAVLAGGKQKHIPREESS